MIVDDSGQMTDYKKTKINYKCSIETKQYTQALNRKTNNEDRNAVFFSLFSEKQNV